MDDQSKKIFEAFLAGIASMTAEKKIKLFLKTREAKSVAARAAAAQEAQFDAILDACQKGLLAEADKSGVKGFSTQWGTTYQDSVLKLSIADESAFFAFVLAQGDLDFFEKRVGVTHVKEYMEANEGELPPGLNSFSQRVMRVRKAGEK